MNKLSVLFISDRLLASSIIGVVKPMLELQRRQEIVFRMKYANNYRESDIIWSDVVVLCRCINAKLLRVIEWTQNHNKRLIYDIDDNFFELSIQSPLGRYHRMPLHLYTVREMIRNATAVRVYSRPMEEISRQWNENTFKLKSYFDFTLTEGVKKEQHDKIRIVYASGRGNTDPMAQLCLPAVARVLNEFPEKTEFYIFGSIPQFMKHLKNVHKLKYISNYSEYIRFSCRKGLDIGLAPLIDDRFHNSKTNNKYREYGGMEVCGIYSNAEIYRECIRDGENGLLVENTSEAWYNAIRRLVEDGELRERIKATACQHVKDEYSFENTLRDWRTILQCKREKVTDFHNYRRARVTVLFDGKTSRNLREEGVTRTLALSAMDFKRGSFQDADLWKGRNCDVCICFASKPNQVDQWITTLRNYGMNNLIMDTALPYEACEKYPDVIFTNPATKAANGYPIEDLYSLSSTNLINLTLDQLVMTGNEASFHELYKYGQDMINSTEEQVFSLNNPIVRWLDLIVRYVEKNPKKKSVWAKVSEVLKKKGYSVWRATVKVYRFVSKPFRWVNEKVVNRLRGIITNIVGSIKINHIKKY